VKPKLYSEPRARIGCDRSRFRAPIRSNQRL